LKQVQRTEEQLETVTKQCGELSTELAGRFIALSQMALRTEVQKRFDVVENQMKGLGQVLGEAQESLGDLSTSILAFGNKVEHADLNVLREEMCQISESVKDREQAVLFGARCLSCNRVFDDVSRDPNAVDLFGEKQRNALFSQVQRALHSPKIDPLAKIKVLAVKIGRPTTVLGQTGYGQFEGRDSSSLACGVDDVQLVPVREAASKSEMLRTEGSISPRKGRRVKGAPQRETFYGGAREGPMDFAHPLSQLLSNSGPLRHERV